MRNGRTVLFLLIFLGLSGIGWLISRHGWEPTWRRWNMVSRSPFFSDLRVITGAMDTLDQGLDPMINNVGAPWHQQFNQPRLWLYVMAVLGIREHDSPTVGVILIVGLLVGLWAITADIGLGAAFYCTLLFFSPATMLIVERCNHDMVLFFLLALALIAAQRSAVLAMVIVYVAFMLKLFPLAGLVLLLRESRRRALWLAGLMLVGAVIYIFATFHEMTVIWSVTEKGADVSYGYNVLWHYLRLQGSAWETPVRMIAYLLVGLSMGATWWFHLDPVIGSEDQPTRQLDSYRLGAGVYAGTFLLGNSWDYRLVFFFFAVPQLFIWLRKNHARRWIALVQLIAFAVASWAMLLTFWISHSETTFIVARGLEELGKWTLFASSLWLLAETLPHWARDLLGFRFRTQTGSAAAPLAPR